MRLNEPGGTVPTLYDHDKFLTYLYELESALSLIAQRDCKGLHAETQLSAAIYVLLRATSLFRAALSLLESGLMDACNVVRRAYWEAWMLGYEFRISGSSSHAMRWHLEKHRHGEPDISRVKAFEGSHAIKPSTYGADYGGLSEVAHPTKSASENSVVTVTALHCNPESLTHLNKARDTIAHDDAPAMMYLLVWTVLAESPDMITLGIKPEAVPDAARFLHEYGSQVPNRPTS